MMTAHSPTRFLWRWFRSAFLIFLTLAVVALALPAPFKLLNVPSFALEFSPSLWLLRWQNQPDVEFNLSFNPLALAAIAAVIGLIETRGRSRRRSTQPLSSTSRQTPEAPPSRRR